MFLRTNPQQLPQGGHEAVPHGLVRATFQLDTLQVVLEVVVRQAIGQHLLLVLHVHPKAPIQLFLPAIPKGSLRVVLHQLEEVSHPLIGLRHFGRHLHASGTNRLSRVLLIDSRSMNQFVDEGFLVHPVVSPRVAPEKHLEAVTLRLPRSPHNTARATQC